jgi:hypothetical protein
MKERTHPPVWVDLEGVISSEVVCAPKTGGDSQGTWPSVDWRNIGYLQRTVAGHPWADHLALVAAVMSAWRYDAWSVKLVICRLHARFTLIFKELAFHQMNEWNAEQFFPPYLKKEILAQDSTYTRERFWIDYSTASKQIWWWLKGLPEPEQERYRLFALPLVPRLSVYGLLHFKESQQRQQQARKQETDALVPHFAAMRAQAHLRYNCLVRLRQACQDAAAQARRDEQAFPIAFS